jgi:hypothetical protein
VAFYEHFVGNSDFGFRPSFGLRPSIFGFAALPRCVHPWLKMPFLVDPRFELNGSG